MKIKNLLVAALVGLAVHGAVGMARAAEVRSR